jgi:hypothetical protein
MVYWLEAMVSLTAREKGIKMEMMREGRWEKD